MPFYEYPKALYEAGDPARPFVVANDQAEELQHRTAGFRMIGEPEPPALPPAPEPAPQPEAPPPVAEPATKRRGAKPQET